VLVLLTFSQHNCQPISQSTYTKTYILNCYFAEAARRAVPPITAALREKSYRGDFWIFKSSLRHLLASSDEIMMRTTGLHVGKKGALYREKQAGSWQNSADTFQCKEMKTRDPAESLQPKCVATCTRTGLRTRSASRGDIPIRKPRLPPLIYIWGRSRIVASR